MSRARVASPCRYSSQSKQSPLRSAASEHLLLERASGHSPGLTSDRRLAAALARTGVASTAPWPAAYAHVCGYAFHIFRCLCNRKQRRHVAVHRLCLPCLLCCHASCRYEVVCCRRVSAVLDQPCWESCRSHWLQGCTRPWVSDLCAIEVPNRSDPLYTRN